jgi:type II secretory pathway pseudopilin PulG
VTKVSNKPSKKFRNIAIILIILALVIAIFVVPQYNKYKNAKRATEIRTALENLRNTVDQQWKSSGTISGITVEAALQKAEISPKLQDKWQFVIAWKLTDIYTTEMVEKLRDVNTNEMAFVSPYRMIMASALPGNPVREGTKIWFSGETNSYHGFGVDDKVEPDWTVMFPNP